MVWLFWVVAVALLLAIEIHTQALYALFLALGAVVGALLCVIGLPFVIQVVAGGVAAIAGVGAARPGMRRLMENRHALPYRFPGVAGGLVGTHAVTLDSVGDEQHPGHALLGNERWLAVTDTHETLPVATVVIVVAVRGTTLLVRGDPSPR